MTTAFCLGNGISRRGIDLERLSQMGDVYGCNALYREFVPRALVATDRGIATEIQDSGYSAKHRFHTRRPITNLGAQTVPKKYYGNSSGPICAALAALDGHDNIYLIGYDMGPALNGRFNNIYADTAHYKSSIAEPTFTGNWIKQLKAVMADFANARFTRVLGPTTAQIPDFTSVKNLSHLPLDTFLERINNGKDL